VEKKDSKAVESLQFLPQPESRVEKIAIFMIPLIFALYNFVYWANYADRISMENGLSVEKKIAY